MGKGNRAHFEDGYQRQPLSSSSANVMKDELALAAEPLSLPHPPLYRPKTIPGSTALNRADVSYSASSHESEKNLEEAPLWVIVSTYLGYLLLIVVGHIRDFFDFRLYPHKFAHLMTKNGYAPLQSGFDTFYHRRLYMRLRDVFNRPITNVPGRTVTLLERYSPDYNHTFVYTGRTRECLNLSSYNYLGFAQNKGPCADAVELAVRKWGISSCSPRSEVGSLELHSEVEKLVARFVGHDHAMVVSMGFATNSTVIPAIASKGCLIISDELNHASLVFGSRLSGASIRIFKHNDASDLDKVLRDAISQGQPRTHRPWKKIIVIVEGLYSMEGDMAPLPEIIELKKKYKFYLYLDEAHSIGAMGPNGRGICDYYGVNPKDVDILMGTFTKSFGSAGGYISGCKDLVEHLRVKCHSAVYAEAVSVPVLQQIYTSMKIIMGEDGSDDGRRRIQQLAANARFFRHELRKMGFIVYGSNDSPVVPVLLFHPSKIMEFSRQMLKRGIAVVTVGYPATPIITSRVRFCLSAAHTREDLEWALDVIREVGDLIQLRFLKDKVATMSLTY